MCSLYYAVLTRASYHFPRKPYPWAIDMAQLLKHKNKQTKRYQVLQVPGLTPGTHIREERTDSQKLSSDLHTQNNQPNNKKIHGPFGSFPQVSSTHKPDSASEPVLESCGWLHTGLSALRPPFITWSCSSTCQVSVFPSFYCQTIRWPHSVVLPIIQPMDSSWLFQSQH